MKKISLLVQYQPVWVCLSQRAVSFRRQSGSSAVGTPFVIAIVIACIAKYACGFVDSRIKCDNA